MLDPSIADESLKSTNYLRETEKVNEKEEDNNSWITNHFKIRKCIKIIPTKKGKKTGSQKCGCGLKLNEHGQDILNEHARILNEPDQEQNPVQNGPSSKGPETWSSYKHTKKISTDAFGSIEFIGGQHPYKAQYARLDTKTDPVDIMKLFTKIWGLELPKLIITLHGGVVDFDLNSALTQAFQTGILKAAKTTNAWIITSGLNSGAAKYVANALEPMIVTSRTQSKIVSIGIVPWGLLKGRNEFVGQDKTVSYHPYNIRDEQGEAVLNHRHSFFLFADNGTVEQTGADVTLRRRLVSHIAKSPGCINGTVPIPIVCVLLSGGLNSICTVYDYVINPPKVPVVAVDGSGRAADLLAYIHGLDEREATSTEHQRSLVKLVQKEFRYSKKHATILIEKIVKIVKEKDLVYVFRRGVNQQNDIDYAILSAVLKSQKLSPEKKLLLALSWNRADLARKNIFMSDAIFSFSFEMLENAFMSALKLDRVEFVRLLLEKGINMQTFLTIERLEKLYNNKYGPKNTLLEIAKGVVNVQNDYQYNLLDIGLIIKKLMAHNYSDFYTSSKFKHSYSQEKDIVSSNPSNNNKDDITIENGETKMEAKKFVFTYPFSDLLIWAVLTNRNEMAFCLWKHGEEALAKALVASRLYKAMSQEASTKNISPGDCDLFKENSEKFNELAVELLDQTHKTKPNKARLLLTYDLEYWGHETCLSLAMISNNKKLLSHSSCEVLMSDLWQGALKLDRNPNFKVLMGIFFPPYILALDFKSQEQLMLQAQTKITEFSSDEKDEKEESTKVLSSKYLNLWKNRSKTSSKVDKKIPGEDISMVQEESQKHTECSSDEKDEQEESTKVLSSKYLNLWKNRSKSSSKVDKRISGKSITLNIEGNETRKLDQDPNAVHHMSTNANVKPTSLSWFKKIDTFYSAPIAAFWSWFINFLVFLIILTYKLLVKLPEEPDLIEWYLFAYTTAFALFISFQMSLGTLGRRMTVYKIFYNNFWIAYTFIASFIFFVGFMCRLMPDYFSSNLVRVIWSVDYILWSLKLLDYCSVHKKFGPYVTIAAKMMLSAKYIIGLVAIALLAFGLPKQSITYQNEEWDLVLIRNIFYKPYFMLYGETYSDEIDTCYDKAWDNHLETGKPLKDINITSDDGCVYGHWVPTVLQTAFMLVVNLLLLNMLIAVFNDTFSETSKMAHEIWHYQRYYQVIGYNLTSFIPPPFYLFLIIYNILKIIFARCYAIFSFCCKKTSNQVSPEEEMEKKAEEFKFRVKLDAKNLDGLHDFEEDCMEELHREKYKLFRESKKERIRITDERTDTLVIEMETLVNYELSKKIFDTRLQNNEEKLNNVVKHLSKIGEQLETITNSMKGLQKKLLQKKDMDKEEEKIVDELKN